MAKEQSSMDSTEPSVPIAEHSPQNKVCSPNAVNTTWFGVTVGEERQANEAKTISY